MKKIFYALLFIPLMQLSAQWDFNLSMGLDFKSTPTYRDYINSNFAPLNNKLSSFISSVNFAGEVGYVIDNQLQIGVEYSLLLDSYNTPIGAGGIYEISYINHRPSLLLYYLIKGEGYKFKFGGGVGPRLISLTEDIIVKTKYTASGVGLLLKAEGNTLISDKLYALIGLNLRYDLTGELSSTDNKKIVNYANGETLKLNMISVGINLGISYLL